MNKLLVSITIMMLNFLCLTCSAQSSKQCFYFEQFTEGKSEKITITIIINNTTVDVAIHEIETKGNFPIDGTQNVRNAEMQGQLAGDKITMNVSGSAQAAFEKSKNEIDRIKKEKEWIYKKDALVIDGTILKLINCPN